MSADLHIHVFTETFTENDYKKFKKDTLGSKYFLDQPDCPDEWDETLYSRCAQTPQIWVGEVSWLKAALCDSPDDFIPGIVLQVHETIGEDFPVIDEDLIEKIRHAFDAGNETGYSVAEKQPVIEWLEKHKGKKAFCVSW